MSSQDLVAAVDAASGCVTAGPWQAACDGVDALPRSADVALVAAFCGVYTAVRALGAIARWRSR